MINTLNILSIHRKQIQAQVKPHKFLPALAGKQNITPCAMKLHILELLTRIQFFVTK